MEGYALVPSNQANATPLPEKGSEESRLKDSRYPHVIKYCYLRLETGSPEQSSMAAFQQALIDGVTAFIVDKNVDNFANALVRAARVRSTPLRLAATKAWRSRAAATC
jgi:hypothetical protein